jgi:DNA-binding ferritin-like protein (Dps family)
MEVSKKENGAYVKQGEVEVFYPLLNEMGIPVEADKMDDEGFPVYADEKVQYVFDSMLAYVKSAARNKLVSGTVQLKEGNKIAETIEELLATGERSGAALALRREFFATLKDFLPSLGKSAAYCAQLYDIISNVKGISAQSAARKALVGDTVAAFAATLAEDKLNAYVRILKSIEEQIEAVSELPD